MKYGDILRWRENPPFDSEPIGRFMYVAPEGDGSTIFTNVMCVVAAPATDWVLFDIVPVAITDLEVVE